MIFIANSSKPPFSFIQKQRLLRLGITLTLLLQISFWMISHRILPILPIVPNPPSPLAVKALSLGDETFYFRVLAFELQNLGDSFGRFTPLKHYDYQTLYRWFELLDALDTKSHFVPSLASYYFSQTQHTQDVRYIVDYLELHSLRDLSKKWWWLTQAIYLANHKLGDKQRALKMAYKLANTPATIPLWARQMPAFIHEQLGEKEAAYRIMKGLIEQYHEIPEKDFKFMLYFIEKRLKKSSKDLW